ncbi:MAG: hypothetical protein A2790_13590 [Phenylobacterium sp. RIFCSPHIGHO2_01_FULL_69_31]|jgi:uncharacterized protein YdbL (DUF1318 family)|uniref:YdbL family protein n=1 Tax=Phenylobacterium sp. RIFCSPHIGHO2_01_FULL_69_31 TaxID=1801944 RepID=UPI0008AE60C6|nr:YdbL family protein [Phenylobacterium sp. RIFCSPHIGHO2_01_FULL_69_31]OHB26889.1 MAG: hypothetical protein A2790_13590 [Phenylobacterium sp. RIFCSPHIGHO2_01_FULL_69_31]
MSDRFNITAAVLAALAITPAAAYAMDAKAAVDAAKAQGVVGEQADGFLGFVKPSSDPALKAAVDEINQGRAALYRQAAAKNGVSVEAAGASAYTTVVQARIKSGEFYKPAGGGWVRK